MVYTLKTVRLVALGRQGENLARTVEIDIADWLKKWPDAQVQLAVKRPQEDSIYIAPAFVEGKYLKWVVTASDTVNPGKGLAELRAFSGETVVKSAVFDTLVLPCLQGNEEPTDQTSAVLGDAILGSLVLA